MGSWLLSTIIVLIAIALIIGLGWNNEKKKIRRIYMSNIPKHLLEAKLINDEQWEECSRYKRPKVARVYTIKKRTCLR